MTTIAPPPIPSPGEAAAAAPAAEAPATPAPAAVIDNSTLSGTELLAQIFEECERRGVSDIQVRSNRCLLYTSPSPRDRG